MWVRKTLKTDLCRLPEEGDDCISGQIFLTQSFP